MVEPVPRTRHRMASYHPSGGTGQLAPLERDVGDPPADGTLNGTRTATALLSVQRTLGAREQGAEKRPMPHPAHLRHRYNEDLSRKKETSPSVVVSRF